MDVFFEIGIGGIESFNQVGLLENIDSIKFQIISKSNISYNISIFNDDNIKLGDVRINYKDYINFFNGQSKGDVVSITTKDWQKILGPLIKEIIDKNK